MNLLNKLTTKNLKLNKKRTIVTIIGIILSVALITAVASMYASGINSLIVFEKHEKGNYHVAYIDVPSNEIETFKNNRKIEKINVVKNIGYANIESINEYKPYVFVKGFSKDALENLAINITKGRLPKNDKEVIIPTHLNTNGRNNLKLGDTITLDVGSRMSGEMVLTQEDGLTEDEKIVNTSKQTYKVVGVMERPASGIEPFYAPGYTFITRLDENNISGLVDVYSLYTSKGLKNWTDVTGDIIHVNKKLLAKSVSSENMSSKELDELDKELNSAKYQIGTNIYLIGLETDPIRTAGVGGLGGVVCVVLAIIVFTSVFCIKNSFDISITEKIKQYGMLRSIVATKKQIKKNVFFEATILGLIGIPLGILLGCIATFILIMLSNYLLVDAFASGIRLVYSTSLIAIIIATILGIITIYFSAFSSARRASKVSPIDSIRNSANIKINSKKIKSPKYIKKLFGVGGDISYKNLKRNRKKYRTTVISIVVSVFIFIASSSFMTMLFTEVDSQFKRSDYNISVSGTIKKDKETYNKYLSILTLDNIDDYTLLRSENSEFKNIKYNLEYFKWLNLKYEDYMIDGRGNYASIYALGDSQYRKYLKILGLDYNEMKDKAILMDYSTVSRTNPKTNKVENKELRLYDYKVGDVLTSVDNKSLEIGYVTNIKPFGLKDIDSEYFVLSEETYNKMVDNILPERIELVFASSNADKLQKQIDDVLKNEDYRVRNVDEDYRMINNLFTLVGIFLYGFIIVISLIGITNIFNTITTNMELRKPEFAMLKSIGMTKKEFSRMIRLETIFMGLKALIFGIPIGIGLSFLMYSFLEDGIDFIFPTTSIIIAILAVFILISLIMKYSINKINKQNTIETIRNENI